MRLLIAAAFFVSTATAQVDFGLKAGLPITDITETFSNAVARTNKPYRWTLGPMIELDLPAGFGIEINALYRRVGYEEQTFSQETKFTDGLWDFPLIGKYKFAGTLARPYVGAGWTYRRIPDLLRFDSSSNGVVTSAGVRISGGVAKISPEVRYTRWANPDFQPGFRTKKNQFEILVGVTF